MKSYFCLADAEVDHFSFIYWPLGFPLKKKDCFVIVFAQVSFDFCPFPSWFIDVIEKHNSSRTQA